MKFKKRTVLFLVLISCFITFSQENILDVKYKRSSLYTLMLSNNSRAHSNSIIESFINTPLSEKFNNHAIGTKIITNASLKYATKKSKSKKLKGGIFSRLPKIPKIPVNISNPQKKSKEDQQIAILNHLNTNNFAKAMIEKWFSRSKKGGFNMSLIAERGSYNATDLDIKIAKQTVRGLAMLSDAGESLINNTFVIVNDFKFTNKEEVAKKVKVIIAEIPRASSKKANTTKEGVEFFGKGYVVKTTAYLYKLVWNEEIAAIFYNDFWTEDTSLDLNRKKAFDKTNIFKLQLVGKQTAWADVQSTVLTKKSNDELIAIATVKAADNVIAKLQRKYEVFRTKTPLLSGDPLSAKIGFKEGLEKGDRYEVLEQFINNNGITKYKRIGVIKVDKDHIWDNRYMAEEENPSTIEFTKFSGSKNKYYSGMLIRQIN
ncbi:MAG: hypothetical protein GXO84_10740 [Chlorobi bacterium]|nr:hypothetical protein [Chlorobiota bacterium]